MLRDMAKDPFLSTFSISPGVGPTSPFFPKHLPRTTHKPVWAQPYKYGFYRKDQFKTGQMPHARSFQNHKDEKKQQKTPPKQNKQKHPHPNCLKIKVAVDQRILKKHMWLRVETPVPEQVPRAEGKTTQKFKPTVPAHRPPTLSRARQRASQLFWGGGGGVIQ